MTIYLRQIARQQESRLEKTIFHPLDILRRTETKRVMQTPVKSMTYQYTQDKAGHVPDRVPD